MLHGIVDALTRPLETYVTALATSAAEAAGDRQVRAVVTRQVIDYVAPRAALVGVFLVAGAATNFYAFATRNRRASARSALSSFRVPLPVVPSAPRKRGRRRARGRASAR